MKHPVNVLDRLGPLCLIDSGDDGVDISRNTLGVNFFPIVCFRLCGLLQWSFNRKSDA